ncbi:globin domain-containing protein [Emticicia sp. BO119]|uniref:globin domain-containing protein n=1 Tax=Emticicia sp. BO119 TaxID=2757768 RepID=UPI0015F0D183|nr:globin domain-containing protein [Emticicia sp. BO119]MBA4848803.1 hemoglobin [Emticicia sp. BO119]
MTNEQVRMIKSTWRSLQGVDPTLLGDVFYSRLFLKEPSLRKMFQVPKEVQAKKLIDMLDLIVSRLDRLDEVSEDIRQLAERHIGYGVKPKHYEDVGKALLWTISKGLGKDWNKEVETAWTACYALLTGAMLDAVSD